MIVDITANKQLAHFAAVKKHLNCQLRYRQHLRQQLQLNVSAKSASKLKTLWLEAIETT